MPHFEAAPSGLLLAAFPPELADLADHPPAGWAIGCVGVGLASASVGAARLIAAHRPSRVLFIGTCGAYARDLEIGDCISVSEVLATSLEEIHGSAYRPPLERTLWKGELPLPFPAHAAANPSAITQTQEGADDFAAMAGVEHLEIAGVFEAARAEGIPAGAVLGVANHVGPRAHDEWEAHHAEVSRQLVEHLRRRGVLE